MRCSGIYSKFYDKAYLITLTPSVVFSGVPTSPLQNLSEPAVEPFRLSYEGLGTYVVNGELDGLFKTETILVSGKKKIGTVAFDTLTSITYTGSASTVTINGLDSLGAPIYTENTQRFDCLWNNSKSGYWGPGSDNTPVWTANSSRLMTINKNIVVGSRIRYDGKDMIVKNITSYKNRVGLEMYRSCQF